MDLFPSKCLTVMKLVCSGKKCQGGHNHRRGESITGTQTNEGQTDSFAMWKCKWDFKNKPLLAYHSENPRVFKKNYVIESKLPVMWRANSKAWVTRQCFMSGFMKSLPQV